ncbi:hypothetical protein [Streptomyces sp. NPDC001851]|uniref:hypothetical protein n=1 Tax=Streptomyces sp. NPDC001851 TaxID=3154529 RepID=UPI00331A2DBF
MRGATPAGGRVTEPKVLGAGIGLLHRPRPVVPASCTPLPDHPGSGPPPRTAAGSRGVTAAYGVPADHDPPARHEVSGPTAARRPRRRNFPGVSGLPLAAGAAGRSAPARFQAPGFRAAAVTAFGAVAVGTPPAPRYVTAPVEAAFDRPFGFLAPHRHSWPVPAAGWVTDPLPFPEDTYATTGRGAGSASWEDDQ